MSDADRGWFDLLTLPLGADPPEDLPLAVLPSCFGLPAPAHPFAPGAR